jgi:pSer/pThr/pTyr-binding forkhead associated (FHA) protein
MPYLIQKKADGTTIREWDLAGKPLSVGRGENVGAQIDDEAMSRQHFRISPGAAGYVIGDLGSTNGTFVNGLRITTQPLKPNDLIRAGDSHFVFVDGLQTVVRQLEKDDRHLSTFIQGMDKKP